MTVVDDLRCARAQVLQRGFFKGWLVDHDGRVCTVGAVNIACYGSPIVAYRDGDDWSRRDAVLNELCKHLPAGFSSLTWEIATYNDAESTTKRDILTLFDKTLASLGGL